MTPRAVLFDCDGVLVDSEPAAFDLLDDELAAHGHAMDREEMERTFVGTTITGVAERARALGVDFAPDWVERFYDRLYARLGEGTALMPGVAAFLDRLDRAGVVYAVGSNGTVRKMETTLSQHPEVWQRLRARLFSGQEIGAPKPDPALYLAAAQALGVAPADCVVVEDSPTGARAGVAAGMRVFGYAPQGGGAALAEVGAEVVDSFDEIAARIGV